MKVSIPGFVYLRTDEYADENSYGWHTCDMGKCDGYESICAHTLEFDLPKSIDHRALKVESLKAEKVKLMADFQNRVTEIERKISELTCLEMS